MYKINPTNTGGKAIKELKKALIIFFHKVLTATKAEIGNAKIVESIKAFIETLRDKKIISYKSSSKEKIKFID